MDKNLNNNWSFLICLTLTLAVLAVFYQVHSYNFITLDDPIYVTENPNIQTGVTLKAVKWAFTTGYANFWHPITWLSLMLDWQLFGDNPAGFHITNLVFHIANTLLLFIVLRRMTDALWQSAFVAALFALHPLHVESVAWISERKDVLSTFFWILTMWAYLQYVKRPKITAYLLVVIVFSLGLMAKPMLVTLPFVFLLLDYWPLCRIRQFNWNVFPRLVLEKIPFMALTIIFSVIAFFMQQRGGAIPSLEVIPLKFRIYNAFISYVKYIEKTVWPNQLSIFYPHLGPGISFFYALMSVFLLLIITILILRFAKNHRYLVTGWFWYLGTLLPVIGLIQVGRHAMADRYTYITLTGLFIIIAWIVPELLAKFRYKKIVLTQLALLAILAISICTWFQIHHWRNSLALFQHAVDADPDNYLAHGYITAPLLEQGRIDEAIWHNSQALRIKPDYIDALNGLGAALHKAGRVDDAAVYYKKAIEINPRTPEANVNLGIILASKGKFTEAVEHYKIAMETMDTPNVHHNFAEALFNLGRFQEAVTEYRKVLSAMPNDPNALRDLGYALVKTGKFDEAVSLYNKALQIAPDSINIHLNLGVALTSNDRLEEAQKEYEKILSIQPQNAVAHNDFGVVLYQQGKLDDAILQFSQAVRINPDYIDAKNNLNTALAEKQKSRSVENEKK